MYRINKIDEELYVLNDETFCSIYLLIGKDKALVIDTGIKCDESILELIRKITKLELIVILTHGHYDHTGNIFEFDRYYLHDLDRECILNRQPENIKYLKNALSINHLDKFDIGNNVLEIIHTPGHTKGSIIIIDRKNKRLFTGDQFGSGCGVWMQVIESITISEYHESLKQFKQFLIDNYDIDFYDWTYFGGHLGQEYTGRLGYNPLNSQMIDNFIELTKLLLKNKVELQISEAKQFNNEQSFYTMYKTAEMIIRKSLIK